MNNVVELWNVKSLDCEYIYDIDTLVKKILDGSKFIICDTYLSSSEPNNILEAKNPGVNVVYTDIDHPVIYSLNSMLFKSSINSEYYKTHESVIKNALVESLLLKNFAFVEQNLFSDDVLDKLLASNIDMITLSEIELRDDQIDRIFESGKKVSLTTNGVYKNVGVTGIIGDYGLDNIENAYLTLDFELSKRDIENFKYLTDTTKIFFDFNSNVAYSQRELAYKNLNLLTSRLSHLDVKPIISCTIGERGEFLSNISNDCKSYNLKILDNLKYREFEDVKNIDDTLKYLVSGALDKGYSPLEKYLYIYDIVKNFKDYNENPLNTDDSRDIGKILINDYIVCVGFTSLLSELLKLADIDSKLLHVNADTSYDEGYTRESKSIEYEAHSRIMIHLDDEKYGIDNYFVADPTWDNDLSKDRYAHALKPFSSMRESKRYFAMEDIDFAFDVDSFPDFDYKVNTFISRNTSKTLDNLIDYNPYFKLSKIIIETLELIDYNVYDNLRDLYKVATSFPTVDNYSKFITKAGSFITKKTNRYIDDELFYAAVFNMKCKIDNSITMEDINNLRSDNTEYENVNFPYKNNILR